MVGLLVDIGVWLGVIVIVLALAIVAWLVVSERVATAVAGRWLRGYLESHAGAVMLVCTTQHGWREVLLNNVIPARPVRVGVVWVPERGVSREASRAIALSRIRCSKPYLAVVAPSGIRVMPIHHLLLPYKLSGRRDPRVQALLRPIVLEALARLEAESGVAQAVPNEVR